MIAVRDLVPPAAKDRRCPHIRGMRPENRLQSSPRGACSRPTELDVQNTIPENSLVRRFRLHACAVRKLQGRCIATAPRHSTEQPLNIKLRCAPFDPATRPGSGRTANRKPAVKFEHFDWVELILSTAFPGTEGLTRQLPRLCLRRTKYAGQNLCSVIPGSAVGRAGIHLRNSALASASRRRSGMTLVESVDRLAPGVLPRPGLAFTDWLPDRARQATTQKWESR